MPPPTKRQKKDRADGGVLHEEDSRGSCPAAESAGPAKETAHKKQREDTADGTPLKDEWRELSKRARSRHEANEVKASLRQMIPGPAKLSDNGLMLQVALRIQQMEIELESEYNKLESNGETSNNKLNDEVVAEVVPAAEAANDGLEALRAVLPQPQASNAKGKRLYEFAKQYLTELSEETDQVKHQNSKRQACTKAQDPPDYGK